MPPDRVRARLTDLYESAVASVEPFEAMAEGMDDLPDAFDRPVHVFAFGKAAHPMAAAAVASLAARGVAPAGGFVVGPEEADAPHRKLGSAAGDHPEPGPRSFAASEGLARAVGRVGTGDEAWVLVSGGASSLIAAPHEGVKAEDLVTLHRHLHRAGLDIATMNQARKRFSRWGGGRLAAALAPARIRVYVISDVVGDDPAAVGSGPCSPDPLTARALRTRLEGLGVWAVLPAGLRSWLAAVEIGKIPETPKPGDPAFQKLHSKVVAGNRMALAGAARRAARLRLDVQTIERPLVGPAAEAGARVATDLLAARPGGGGPWRCLLWGGETTVALGPNPGHGGRCQELALAAAGTLSGRPGVALLAAGTDGRDGPTDAAGAIVDGSTWARIERAGVDPRLALSQHGSYRAHEAVGGLFRTGLTGTNVMDVVIGLCWCPDGEGAGS